jgi:hypothetical protein
VYVLGCCIDEDGGACCQGSHRPLRRKHSTNRRKAISLSIVLGSSVKGGSACDKDLASSDHRFSRAEFDEVLAMARDQDKIFCTNEYWWNRKKHREKLM